MCNSKDNFNKNPLDYALAQKSKTNLKLMKKWRLPDTENIDVEISF